MLFTCKISAKQYELAQYQCTYNTGYRKIPKISPQTGNAKSLALNRPSKYKSPGACTWKIALKYKVKQSINDKFTSNYMASSIDFETQISLRREAPPKISPQKGPLKNISPGAYFRNFKVPCV